MAVRTDSFGILTGADNFLLVKFKVQTWKLLVRLRKTLRLIIRFIRLDGRLLGLPEKRVKSLREWIVNERQTLDWWNRCWGPYYEEIAPAKGEVGFRQPLCVISGQKPEKREEQRYHVYGEVFLAGIPQGRVLGPSGVIVTPDGGIVEESAWCDGWLEADRAMTALRLPRPEKLQGHYFFLGGDLIRGYAHWIFDALPRLMMLDRLNSNDLTLIVFGKLNTWQEDSLRIMGFDHYQRELLHDRYIECEFLHFPSAVGKPGNTSPLALSFLREKLMRKDAVGIADKRLYVTRRKAGRRHVVNEEELKPILEDHGFELVETENLTLQEQIDLFARAEMVIGPHGAGLSNLAFAPSECRVLELFSPTCLRWMYYYLASARKQEYWYLIGDYAIEAEKYHRDSGFDNMHIDRDQFVRAVEALVTDSTSRAHENCYR
jgi:capsular polysaccharide biosynthesis protein